MRSDGTAVVVYSILLKAVEVPPSRTLLPCSPPAATGVGMGWLGAVGYHGRHRMARNFFAAKERRDRNEERGDWWQVVCGLV